MTQTCLDLFAGLGGFSAAFADADGWDVVSVDIEEEFDPDIQADILSLGPSDLPDADIILASPPCKAFSLAASGTHIDGEGDPITDFGANSILLVHHTVGLIESINPEYWIIENPMGGMRKQLGTPDRHVWYCQYGEDRAKPTDLWGDIPPTFRAKSCSNGNTSCHHEKAKRGQSSGTQGIEKSAERAKVPYELSEAILEAVEGRAEQTTLQEVSA